MVKYGRLQKVVEIAKRIEPDVTRASYSSKKRSFTVFVVKPAGFGVRKAKAAYHVQRDEEAVKFIKRQIKAVCKAAGFHVSRVVVTSLDRPPAGPDGLIQLSHGHVKPI